MEFKDCFIRILDYIFDNQVLKTSTSAKLIHMDEASIQNYAEISKELDEICSNKCTHIKTIMDAKKAYNIALKCNKSPKLIIAKWCDLCIINLNNTDDIDEMLYIYVNSPTEDVKQLVLQKWDNVAFEIIKRAGPEEINYEYYCTPNDGISRIFAKRKIESYNLTPLAHQK